MGNLREDLGDVDPSALKLFYHPAERLRLTVGESRSYVTVKPVWAAPLTRPDRFLALLDGTGEEILMISNPKALPSDSRQALQREIRQRYLTAVVSQVTHARQEFGATYWSVETDRGTRDFVTQSLQENAQWFSDTHLLLIDVDGNRFEIKDVGALDEKSRGIIEEIL
ncbi:MAG TPA: DUF1854 domain-containing protein [Armatimonadota bacterium]|nr:DUF1854 domain-containing protein [Armatimonadota bacterium]